jgi:hypothetical protein
MIMFNNVYYSFSPITHMIENMKEIITGLMESEYLGLIKIEKESKDYISP